MPIKQPELIHKVTDGPNKHGIRKVILKKGKYISDPKTIGPDHWNQVDYIKHLREAYNNVTEKKFVREGVFQLTGTDQSGIRWYMYVELQNNSYKITTGYPIYE